MRIRKEVVGPLSTNCYFLYNDSEMIIVDPGGDAEKIIQTAKEIGVPVSFIVNTHSHYDHTAANTKVGRETKASILDDLGERKKLDIGEDSLEIIHTPGHTKDSFCLLGDGFLIAGDVLFEDGRGRTDLKGGSIKEMKETIEMLKQKLLPETVIYPGHGNSFIAKDHYLLSGRKTIKDDF